MSGGARLPSASAFGRHDPGDRRRGRRAKSAHQRDPVAHRDPPADPVGDLAAEGDERRLEALDEAVVAVLGQLVDTLAVDLELDLAAAPAPDLDLDPVGQVDRPGPGSRSPRRGSRSSRGLRRRSAARRAPPASSRPPCPPAARYQPSAAMTASVVGSASRMPPTWALRRVRVLEPAPGQDADDRRIGATPSRSAATSCADARPRSPPTTARRTRPRAGRDRGRRPGSARRSPPRSGRRIRPGRRSPCVQLAGSPIRIAVATVSGSATGWPSTIGAAPAAWKPYIRGVPAVSPASR